MSNLNSQKVDSIDEFQAFQLIVLVVLITCLLYISPLFGEFPIERVRWDGVNQT